MKIPLQNSVTLRPSRPGDGLGVARVRIAAWQRAYAAILDSEFLAKLDLGATAAKYEERFASLTPRDRTTLAILNEEIVGYCVCGCKVDAPYLGEPFMYALYVDPETQGCGIGSRLLAEALQWAGSIGGTRLLFGVFQANIAAIGFYERHGASVVYSEPYEIDGKSYPTDYCEIPISRDLRP